ncbi:hypothetical protein HZ326_3041 [Fusarium oxysporum f. sp. albedinis]|nr:hypothetical protein HZ326_3041 [Fusarium oxysporum f. sp. albedinis]
MLYNPCLTKEEKSKQNGSCNWAFISACLLLNPCSSNRSPRQFVSARSTARIWSCVSRNQIPLLAVPATRDLLMYSAVPIHSVGPDSDGAELWFGFGFGHGHELGM